jgi:hypothetical protein
MATKRTAAAAASPVSLVTDGPCLLLVWTTDDFRQVCLLSSRLAAAWHAVVAGELAEQVSRLFRYVVHPSPAVHI